MAFPDKNRSLLESVKYAVEGINEAVRVEKNLKKHLVLTGVVILAGIFFNISSVEWMAIVLSIGLVLGMELINTSIEYAVDLACNKQYHELAKKAKDASAGAVLTVAIMSVVIGMIIFIPKLWDLFLVLIN